MSSIEKHVNDFYQSQSLGPARLEHLLKETRRVKRKRFIPKAAVAAMLMIFAVGSVFYFNGPWKFKNHVLLQEASVNHRSKLQLEFDSHELTDLTNAMGELDFALVLPEKIKNTVDLIGARYCTLNGKLAAHVKLKDSDTADDISLFMTATNTEFEKLGASTESIDGVKLSSWSSDGLFYVLASSH